MNKEMKEELKAIVWAAFLMTALIALIVSVSLIFFLQNISLTEEQIRTAAPATFVLVLFISVVSVLIYAVLRYFTEIRPMNRISHTLDQIARGNFDERLEEDGQYGNFKPFVTRINRMTDELESSALMKTDFAANLSHELKTPLAVIKNYGTLLQGDNVTEEERREYAEIITASSGRMSELISNILRLNRLDNQKLEAKHEEFDLSAQLTECLIGFESIWEEKEIDLDVDITDEIHICSDEELLSLVWNNLLSNAFKFTERGGTVRVSLKEENGSAVVSVTDTGCGMDETTGRHIFDKFYQGDTSHASQGNGLGLALVKRVIDLVDGEISVKSTLGEGSTFTVKIGMR